MNRAAGVPVLIAILLIPGRIAAQAPTDSAAIHERSRAFSAAYERGDAAFMAGIYLPDAAIFPERSEIITGKDAIQRYWTLAPDNKVTRHVATPTRIHVQGNTAWDYGVYEVSGVRNGKAWGPSRGKYVIVWQKTGGQWLMQLDIWNSRPPASP